jgi:hypothetical protein
MWPKPLAHFILQKGRRGWPLLVVLRDWQAHFITATITKPAASELRQLRECSDFVLVVDMLCLL